MTVQTLPGVGLVAGWEQKSNGWGDAMNANLRLIDLLLQPSAKGISSAPPASPSEGDKYIVLPGATGSWSAKGNMLALFLNGAWTFYPARAGWRLYVIDLDQFWYFGGEGWRLEPMSLSVSLGFASGYLNNVSLSSGASLVWTTRRLDDTGVFSGGVNSNIIVVPAAWNNRRAKIKLHVQTLHSSSETTVNSSSQKALLKVTSGSNVQEFRSAGGLGYALSGVDLATDPILLKTGDTIEASFFSNITLALGLSDSSHLYFEVE